MQEFQLKEEWAKELEMGLEEYMDRLMESLDDEDIDDTTLSGEMFCGCHTCYFREMLFFVSPRIIKGNQEGDIWLVPSES